MNEIKVIQLAQGTRFGRLTVVERFGSTTRSEATWLCDCDCGEQAVVSGSNLRRGGTRSCGCLRREMQGNGEHHGMSGTPEYTAWRSMKMRCYNPGRPGFYRYGGRGIKVCQRWLDSFAAFYEDVGDRPSEGRYMLMLIDLDHDFEPGNVCWTLASECDTRERPPARMYPKQWFWRGKLRQS